MKLFKNRRRNKKTYNYKYNIYWKNGGETTGEVKNLDFSPVELLLNNKMTFCKDKAYYYNSDDIRMIFISDYYEEFEGQNDDWYSKKGINFLKKYFYNK